MGRRLSDIRFVDLQRSKVDWNKSDPENGKYVFKGSPIYVDYKSDSAPVPDHKITWVEHDVGNVDRWIYKYDYSVILAKEKLYWPEGFVPNAEGRYKYRDTVLMMCPAHLYVARKKREHEQSVGAAAKAEAGFHAMGREAGVVTYSQDEMQDMRRHLRR